MVEDMSDFEKVSAKSKAELEKLLERTQTSINAIVMEEMADNFNVVSWQLNLYTTTMAFTSGLMEATIKACQEIAREKTK